MGVLVEPAWSFTIPSLADDTPLDCRIYHPPHFEAVLANAAENGHATRGAVVAHPYAPLGGSYDDAVVLALVKCLLREGFVVGTFNFRYVLSSQTISSSIKLTNFAEGLPARKEAQAGLDGWRSKTLRPLQASWSTTYKSSNQVTTPMPTMADPNASQPSFPHAPHASMIPKATTTPSLHSAQHQAHEATHNQSTPSPSSSPATPTAP
jgi:hypothetical protein